ncbi:glycosyltransferase family 4 protein [Tenacibaculum maritimum]|uniref:glycosyltransferase family 4 protein n=1 Tax=Tenacibaculum maritimum TaxID=107401 RepID=UPI0012E42E87|nr:glycosyltransferase family 4 protein [Tenacibaculum maritimum]CAA0145020.1 Glycosyltransferase, family GT4 [Tenacibaculum maritimum]CAA0145028.1 Glycosyltransferase, family GT4 [Tenacibaculum maritimum]CAA0145155.1 Glycosyltransferase, family GT4 [Tenacibaculum maritimum]CAA0155513.1 Glycosyltransferase, family GT4 [Tenacibaculum maritimum]CAA0164155.1 Glycosyltransferase, family GT4 [Tenacibaculum maritimum]
MTIIHIITSLGIGGAEKLLVNVVNEQVKQHSVHIIYLKPIKDLVPLLDANIKVKQIPLNFLTVSRLKKYYKTVKPTVIHTHLGHADLLGIWSARNQKANIFCTMHNIYFKKNFLDAIFFKCYTYLFLKISKNCKVISISKSVEEHVLKKLKLPQNRSFLLYNAIPNSIKAYKTTKNKTINLLFIGRLEKQKSIPTFLKAIYQLKQQQNVNITATIVGDGSLKKELETLAKKLQIKHLVNFVGKQEDTNPFYNNAGIFILPSIWEGFGIVLLEAFRAKVPIIASNIEGPSELINHNVNGLLFEPENHIELANHILLLINNSSLRERLAQKGFSTFTEKFQINTYVKKLNELYEHF